MFDTITILCLYFVREQSVLVYYDSIKRVHYFLVQMKGKMIHHYLLIGFHISKSLSSHPYDFIRSVITSPACPDAHPGQMARSWSTLWYEDSVL